MKKLIITLMAVALLLSMALPVSAAVEEAPLTVVDVQKDLTLWVDWDVEQPYLVFLAPDGTEYDFTAQIEGTQVSMGENCLYYTILNAPAGQWNIRYDKGANSVLEISVHDYAQPLSIKYFTLGNQEGSRMDVNFRVDGKENQRYQYKISAMVDHTGTEKELLSGSSVTNSDNTEWVDLRSLSSYGAYILKLYVWYEQDGADIFDFAFSDSFSYTNPDAETRDFLLRVEPATGVVYVTVQDLGWYAQSVLVAVFENGGMEPELFDEYAPEDANNLKLAFDPAATEVSVEVAVMYDGIYGAPVRKTFRPGNMGISIPEGEAFNSLVLPITYTGMNGELVDIQVNGDHNEVVLRDDGKMNLTLTDDWNALSIQFTDSQSITWVLERNIFVDRLAPVLSMSQDYDGMEVSERELTVSGSVTDYHTLTINGQTVTADASGIFTQKVTLADGANSIDVVATDSLGNEARYSALVFFGTTQQEWVETEQQKSAPGGLLEILTGPGSFWPMIITGGLCLMVIGYALIFWRREDKK